MSLEPRTLEQIAQEFSPAEQASVAGLLVRYAGPEIRRVQWDILRLSKGSLANVRRYVEAAQVDHRDVLYWAEYHATDPLLRGHDPKRLVEDILAKWGDQK